jgi:uncharacterized secreted protein with C-terminal beta-propeller domain
MITHRIARVALLATFIASAAISYAATSDSTAPRKTLQAFSSEDEIAALFKKWADERQRRLAEQPALRSAPLPGAMPSAPLAQYSAPKALARTESVAAAAESITNVQHAGVDEGGIVKVHGDHLVILRRGRLFTVGIRDRQLKSTATLDAFGKGVDPRGAWYDELLISGDTIVVIG